VSFMLVPFAGCMVLTLVSLHPGPCDGRESNLWGLTSAVTGCWGAIRSSRGSSIHTRGLLRGDCRCRRSSESPHLRSL